MDVFPASLTVVHSAGLADALDSKTTDRLKAIESEMRERVEVGQVLRAHSQEAFDKVANNAIEVAADYYVEAGILIWRALDHDYTKLLQLSRISSLAIESQLFEHAELFEKTALFQAIAALRTFGHVGELLVQSQESLEPQERTPPVLYLNSAVFTSFIAYCLLAYAAGRVKRARKVNLMALAEAIFSVAKQTYQSALKEGVFRGSTETQTEFWSPEWQLGEVEADLDIQGGALKRFHSAEDLVEDLKSS